MTLDSEAQRQMLLQLIDNAQFPGKARRQVMALAVAIETADVESPENGKQMRDILAKAAKKAASNGHQPAAKA